MHEGAHAGESVLIGGGESNYTEEVGFNVSGGKDKRTALSGSNLAAAAMVPKETRGARHNITTSPPSSMPPQHKIASQFLDTYSTPASSLPLPSEQFRHRFVGSSGIRKRRPRA